jgi:hypothetical protein
MANKRNEVVDNILSDLYEQESACYELLDNSIREDIGFMITRNAAQRARLELQNIEFCKGVIAKYYKSID